jgi:hypothetical protein
MGDPGSQKGSSSYASNPSTPTAQSVQQTLIAALIAFVVEMLLAGRGIRTEVTKQRQSAAQIRGGL